MLNEEERKELNTLIDTLEKYVSAINELKERVSVLEQQSGGVSNSEPQET